MASVGTAAACALSPLLRTLIVPFDLQISHTRGLVEIAVSGTWNDADLDEAGAKVVQENALSYGKLIDIRGVTVELSDASLRAHAGKFSVYASRSGTGALALVADQTTKVDPTTLVALAAAISRPYRIFTRPPRAVEWLRRRRSEMLGARGTV